MEGFEPTPQQSANNHANISAHAFMSYITLTINNVDVEFIIYTVHLANRVSSLTGPILLFIYYRILNTIREGSVKTNKTPSTDKIISMFSISDINQ